MELSVEYKGDTLKAVVKGESISASEAVEFKKRVASEIAKNSPKRLVVAVEDAYTLPSSLVGALLKHKEIEKIDVELAVRKKELKDILDSLSLSGLLNTKLY